MKPTVTVSAKGGVGVGEGGFQENLSVIFAHWGRRQ